MPHQRKCTKTKTTQTRANQRIVVPIEPQDYEQIVGDTAAFRRYVDEMIKQHPELFPNAIDQGYRLYGLHPASKKMPELAMRRIRLHASGQVYTVAPSFVMPYATGYVQDVEKALFLRRFGVPYWGLTYVFGRNDMYWQRLVNHLGRYDLVGTTVKTPPALPVDLLADEKHIKRNGEKAYIATTVGGDCVLGASVALKADTAALTAAYGQFQREAQRLDPVYRPQTVNTDGWDPTQNAWRTLFPLIVIIECFLHAFLKVRDRGQRLKALYPELQQRIWDAYHAVDARAFYHQLDHLSHWATQSLSGPVLEAVLKLCAKASRFVLAFDYPHAYRTSNMIDRHMEPLARCLFSARFFHGHLQAAEWQVRAWALSHNFQPYCPRAKIRQHYLSPVHKLNGSVYHDNWLQNLLISTSIQRVLYVTQNPLE
jgi:hypothetical protein